MKKVLLFNPRAANSKPRIPNSVLSVAATLNGLYEWVIVDGNLEVDPWTKIEKYLASGEFFVFASTVMPGPQLKQAIPFSKKVRESFKKVRIIWGDFVVNGPGEKVFPALLKELETGTRNFSALPNLIFKNEADELITTKKDEIYDQDLLPSFPYAQLNGFYDMRRYLGKTCLGTKTIAYHSSFGCPFTCSFCAVVPIYNARWKGKSAEKIYKDILYLKNTFGGNAIEFHDNNFFVSEKRTVEFSNLIKKENMIWWGEGRIDTINKYSDESLAIMRESGCKMIFFGAETGNDDILKRMDKGGTQSAAQIRSFAARMKKFDIIPEYSFVLGMPGETEEESWKQIKRDVEFIREIKEINPDTEIIIYVYSPVPVEGSELYEKVRASGFHYPEKLEDWISPAWEKFDLRKNPLTPWLTSEMIDYIRNFETVLNGYFPTYSDIRLNDTKIKILKKISAFRYKNKVYSFPYEIKAIQKLWKYRQPEIEGF